jgi:hypothetical protein
MKSQAFAAPVQCSWGRSKMHDPDSPSLLKNLGAQSGRSFFKSSKENGIFDLVFEARLNKFVSSKSTHGVLTSCPTWVNAFDFDAHGAKHTANCNSIQRSAVAYGAFEETTPMSAILSPFLSGGTASRWRMTPEFGARGSERVLPKKSVT